MRTLKALVPRESDEQAVLVSWLRMRGVSFFSVPNGAMLGGWNKYALLNKLKREGLLPGAPDLVLVPLAPTTGRPVCVEMKRAKNGKLRKSQEAVLPVLERAAWHVIVAHGAQEAIDQILRLGY